MAFRFWSFLSGVLFQSIEGYFYLVVTRALRAIHDSWSQENMCSLYPVAARSSRHGGLRGVQTAISPDVLTQQIVFPGVAIVTTVVWLPTQKLVRVMITTRTQNLQLLFSFQELARFSVGIAFLAVTLVFPQ